MKQLLQNLASGISEIQELPSPAVPAGNLLIRTSCSLLSSGTERMLVNFGRANWIEKVQQQPEKVKQVVDKVKTNGVLNTCQSVLSKLDEPITLGYSNVGIVLEVGSQVSGFKVGDRVVSNGCHAELVSVPQKLCALIPDEVTNEAASFTILASIALQGISPRRIFAKILFLS